MAEEQSWKDAPPAILCMLHPALGGRGKEPALQQGSNNRISRTKMMNVASLLLGESGVTAEPVAGAVLGAAQARQWEARHRPGRTGCGTTRVTQAVGPRR